MVDGSKPAINTFGNPYSTSSFARCGTDIMALAKAPTHNGSWCSLMASTSWERKRITRNLCAQATTGLVVLESMANQICGFSSRNCCLSYIVSILSCPLAHSLSSSHLAKWVFLRRCGKVSRKTPQFNLTVHIFLRRGNDQLTRNGAPATDPAAKEQSCTFWDLLQQQRKISFMQLTNRLLGCLPNPIFLWNKCKPGVMTHDIIPSDSTRNAYQQRLSFDCWAPVPPSPFMVVVLNEGIKVKSVISTSSNMFQSGISATQAMHTLRFLSGLDKVSHIGCVACKHAFRAAGRRQWIVFWLRLREMPTHLEKKTSWGVPHMLGW